MPPAHSRRFWGEAVKMIDEPGIEVYQGDCRAVLATLPDGIVNTCVTSPPYFGLRDYGVDGQIGLEQTPDAYVAEMVAVFSEVRRVLRDDGTVWLNLGDSYAAQRGGTPMPAETLAGGVSGQGDKVAKRGRESEYLPHRNAASLGLKHKDLIGIPWRVALALQADGWYLRQDIIWHKPNPMPESVTDRCTKAHEYIFLLAKSERYYFDHAAIQEPAATGWNGSEFHDGKNAVVHPNVGKKRQPRFGGNKYGDNDDPKHATKSGNEYCPNGLRNKRSVWTVNSKPYKAAHFATYPPELIEPCVHAGCPDGGIVLDPFNGSGTTGEVARRWGKRYVGIELNPEYIELTRARLCQRPLFVA
jgi:DNA modification methylase